MVHSYKFKLLYTAFLQNIKLSGYKVEIKFHKDSLVVEQENYKTKNIDAYIVYDLGNCPNNPLRNFTLKDCFFCATSIVKNSDKEKWVYSSYGIAFSGKGS